MQASKCKESNKKNKNIVPLIVELSDQLSGGFSESGCSSSSQSTFVPNNGGNSNFGISKNVDSIQKLQLKKRRLSEVFVAEVSRSRQNEGYCDRFLVPSTGYYYTNSDYSPICDGDALETQNEIASEELLVEGSCRVTSQVEY